jgi:serine/threonine-protein kinase
MGSIYKARDARLDVDVAIKEMRPQPDMDAETLAQLRQQFRQEAAVLARLDHPNLVRVTDFFEEGGNAYLVMDFLEGETLAQRIVRQGMLSEAQVMDWGRQLLGALAYCHKQGVLHRDIKPQNILLREDGRAVLIDFGLVKLWDARNPQTQTVMRGVGTPEYAPPEQYGATDQHTDPRSDLYALGATLYHALTGERPLSATDRMALPENFKMPRMIRPDVNPQTEFTILKAMALKVRDRWSSAEQMLQALNQAGTGRQTAPAYSATTSSSITSAPPARFGGQPAYTAPAGVPASQPLPTGAHPSQPQPAGARPSQPLVAPAKPSRALAWIGGLGGLALVGVLLLGCGLLFLLRPWDDDGGTATPATLVTPRVVSGVESATPTHRPQNPTPRSSTPTPRDVGTEPFQVTIDNQSGENICYVLISSSEEDKWGEDWLGADEVIENGTSWTAEVTAGAHDLMVKNCEGVVLGTAWELSEDKQITVGGSGLIAFEVRNTSSTDVCYAYFSPATDDTWGKDWLGAKESIAAQEGTRIFYVKPGTYDLLVRDCDNNDLAQKEKVDLTAEITWTIED